jgi:hypothetical protein
VRLFLRDELDRHIDFINMEVGHSPGTLGDDDDVANTDPTRRHVVNRQPPGVRLGTPCESVRCPKHD